jgi:hypothetical protein
VVLEKNANFFAENGQKSQKIVIITSTSGQTFAGLFFGLAAHLVPNLNLLRPLLTD